MRIATWNVNSVRTRAERIAASSSGRADSPTIMEDISIARKMAMITSSVPIAMAPTPSQR